MWPFSLGGAFIKYPVALISDIHANLDAFQVVLEDISARGIKRVVCLGDTVGYGPNPRECLDLVMEHCEWMLMGNHDYAAMYEPTNFNIGAEAASYWTREQLEQETDREKRNRRWHFLGDLPFRQNFDFGLLAVHGSPRRPINEYIFADDINNSPVKMQQIFDRVERCCMVGHTHVQGVFTEEPDFYSPAEIGGVYEFRAGEKTVINVGSVGQPRDRDPRSGYAILHKEKVEFVRLEYNIDAVASKVQAIPALNDFFGQRLYEGR
ncbi:MAG: metallophosphatase family protein [Phycisphaerae bacterium]|nr:metallophosphatase family protein [Phycisphaerae bacterium]